jgi:hypothetical protein
MFVFAIETNGDTVAFTKEQDPIMLEGFLSGNRDEGKFFRDEMIKFERWDGTSPFTARLATASEALDYEIIHETAEGPKNVAWPNTIEIESSWYLNL